MEEDLIIDDFLAPLRELVSTLEVMEKETQPNEMQA